MARRLFACALTVVLSGCPTNGDTTRGGPCLVNADCDALLRCCLNEAMTARTCESDCEFCRVDADCPGGADDTCCPDGRCANEFEGCGNSCETSAECRESEHCCPGGELLTLDPTRLCRGPGECACTDDSECAEGWLCCPSNLPGWEGQCKTACGPCTTDDDCGPDLACCVRPSDGETFCLREPCTPAPPPDAGPGRDGGPDPDTGTPDAGRPITEGPVTVIGGEGLIFIEPTLYDVAAFQRVIVAGEGVGLYAAETGMAIEEWADAASTYYRAIGLRLLGSLGANDAIVAVGSDGYAIRQYQPGTGFSMFQQLGAAGVNVTDVVPMPPEGGVSPGFWYVDNTNSQVRTYSALGGAPPRWSTTQLGMTGATGRAVAFDPGAAGEDDLVLTTEELLIGSGTTIARNTALSSPSGGFRDVVRDGDTCAVSDFPTRVIVFSCSTPATQAVIAVAGPVGLGIQGNRVLASGSTDGSIHLISWDGAAATEVVHDVSAIAPAPSWVAFYPGEERAAFSGGGIYGTVSLE